MANCYCFLLLVVVRIVGALYPMDPSWSTPSYDNITSNSTSCPPWYFHNGEGCECGSDLDGRVHCDPATGLTLVLDGYCMTYDNNTGKTLVGVCLYTFLNISKVNPYLSNYHKLPLDSSEFNNKMCGLFNRRGQLCGQCEEGYFSPVYSYDLQCTKCSVTSYNWAKYILAAFGPLTLFLLIIFLFRINVTSPPLINLVGVSQVQAAPLTVRVLLASIEGRAAMGILNRTWLSLYGIWNLDFFRTLLPPICLQLTTLQTLALDYVIAFYPLVLIVLTYFVIELHMRNYRLVQWLWRPFHTCCARFRSQRDVRTSLIDVFATFLFLSVIKFLSVSFDILVPIQLFDVYGQRLPTRYLYFDATVEYFGKEHLPYAILALLVLLTVVVLPVLLLILYPFRCFQKCLTCFRMRTPALHIFMDAFQGRFKDGTNGTHDCRYFAAVYLGIGLLLYIVFAFTINIYVWPLYSVIFLAFSISHHIFKPYKVAIHNTIASLAHLALALQCILILAEVLAQTYASNCMKMTVVLGVLIVIFPQLFILGVVIHWLIQKRILQTIVQKLCIRRTVQDFEEMLPDRLANPELYETLPSDPVENEEEELSDNPTY